MTSFCDPLGARARLPRRRFHKAQRLKEPLGESPQYAKRGRNDLFL